MNAEPNNNARSLDESDIQWLGEGFAVDARLIHELIERLYEEGVIDCAFADTLIYVAEAADATDAREFADAIGAEVLAWLAAYSSPLGCDHPQFEPLTAYLSGRGMKPRELSKFCPRNPPEGLN